jgi:hypothetical protein
MSRERLTLAMWIGGLVAGTVGLWAAMVLGPLGIPVYIAALAFGALRPRSASAGGILLSAGSWILWGELRLVQSCNAMNVSPQGRCTHEDVTIKIFVEVALIVLGVVLSTYAFARSSGLASR